MDRSRIGIIIPALNEEATIEPVIKNASSFGIPIVVDDGSHDRTSEIAKSCGAIVVRHATNQGYDVALQSGFVKANELSLPYAITIDADGQHDPLLIKTFIDKLEEGNDLVVGVRDKFQRFGEFLFSVVGRLLWNIDDPLCGMKAYNMTLFNELGYFDSYKSIGSELSIYAARNRKKIAQIQVKTRDRVGTPRFGRLFQANVKIIKALLMAFRL